MKIFQFICSRGDMMINKGPRWSVFTKSRQFLGNRMSAWIEQWKCEWLK